MKLTKQVLVIIIAITGLSAIYVGYLSFSNSNKMLDLFHIMPMPGMDMLIVFLGLYFFTFAIIYLFDSYMLYKRRQAGRSLAQILGFVSLVSGIVMYMKYKQYSIESGTIVGLVEAVKGGLILLLASASKD